MSSRTMDADNTTALAQVASVLQDHVDAVRIEGFAALPDPDKSPLLKTLETCDEAALKLEYDSVSLRAHVAASAAALDALEERRDEAYTAKVAVLAEGKDASPLEGELQKLETQINRERARGPTGVLTLAEIDQALELHAATVSVLLTPPAAGRPPIPSALAREPLHLQGGPGHVLVVSVDSIGADSATPQCQLQGAGHVLYVGGLQVSWMLLNVAAGTVKAADVKRQFASARLNLKYGSLHATNRAHQTRPSRMLASTR